MLDHHHYHYHYHHDHHDHDYRQDQHYNYDHSVVHSSHYPQDIRAESLGVERCRSSGLQGCYSPDVGCASRRDWEERAVLDGLGLRDEEEDGTRHRCWEGKEGDGLGSLGDRVYPLSKGDELGGVGGEEGREGMMGVYPSRIWGTSGSMGGFPPFSSRAGGSVSSSLPSSRVVSRSSDLGVGLPLVKATCTLGSSSISRSGFSLATTTTATTTTTEGSDSVEPCVLYSSSRVPMPLSISIPSSTSAPFLHSRSYSHSHLQSWDTNWNNDMTNAFNFSGVVQGSNSRRTSSSLGTTTGMTTTTTTAMTAATTGTGSLNVNVNAITNSSLNPNASTSASMNTSSTANLGNNNSNLNIAANPAISRPGTGAGIGSGSGSGSGNGSGSGSGSGSGNSLGVPVGGGSPATVGSGSGGVSRDLTGGTGSGSAASGVEWKGTSVAVASGSGSAGGGGSGSGEWKGATTGLTGAGVGSADWKAVGGGGGGSGSGTGEGGGVRVGGSSNTNGIPGGPTNDDIEAVIQAATSSSRPMTSNPPRDTRTQLFVGNLPYRVRWQDLKDLFRKAGTVLRADVSLGPDNRSRGYGTVLLATAEDAGRAVDMFNGYEWMTRVLEVRPDRMGALPASDDSVPQPPGVVGGYAVNLGVGVGVGMGGVGVGVGGGVGVVGPGVVGLSQTLQIPRYPGRDTSGGGSPSPFPGGFGVGLNLGMEEDPSLAGRSLFVGNLPFHMQWQDLKDLFRLSGGTILRADVALGVDGRSRGFGMVTYATESDAESARKMFNGYEYNGRALKVHYDKFAAPASSAIGSSSTPAPPSLLTSAFSSTTNSSSLSSTNAHPSPAPHPRHPISISQPQSPMNAPAFAFGGGSGGGLNGSSVSPNPIQQIALLHQSHSAASAPSLPHPHSHPHQHPLLPLSLTHSHPHPTHQRSHSHSHSSQSHGRSLSIGSMSGLSNLAQHTLLGKREASPASSTGGTNSAGPSGTFGLAPGSSANGLPRTSGGSSAEMLYRQNTGGGSSQVSQSQARFSPLVSTNTISSGGEDVFIGGRVQSNPYSSSIYSTPQAQPQPPMVMQQGARGSRFLSYPIPQLSSYPAGPEELSPFEFNNPHIFALEGGLREGQGSGAGLGMGLGTERLVEAEVMQPGSRLDFGGSKFDESGQPRSGSEDPPEDVKDRATNPESTTIGEADSVTSNSAESTTTSNASTTMPQASRTHHQSPTSNQHPAHPGPISLPPPPPVGAFPIPPPHSLSPHPYMPMSPYMSPLYHPSIAMGMGMSAIGMTPHGLPPITPSMPSFTFLPPPPLSPGLSSPYGEDMSFIPPMRRRGSSGNENRGDEPSSSRVDGGNASTSPPPPKLHQQQTQHQYAGQQQTGQAPYHHPAMMSPYAPFSPGVTMSPGTFWGRPGGGANPYINPAVGAPVHSIPPHQAQQPPAPGGFYAVPMQEEYGYFRHMSPIGGVYAQPYMEYHEEMRDEAVVTEAEGYFPFVPPANAQGGAVGEVTSPEQANPLEDVTKGLAQVGLNESREEGGADGGKKENDGGHRAQSVEVAGADGSSKHGRILPRAGSDPSHHSSASGTKVGNVDGGSGHVGKRKPDLEIDVARSKTEGWAGRGV